MSRVFLIDGSSFCYRAFYAIRELSNSKGHPTNAVYGFVMMLKKLIEEERPDYLAVAFDLKGPTFRHERFKEYKIHRRPMPDALSEQIPLIKEVIKAYRIPIFEKAGFEADDILATIARQVASSSRECYIVTGDKDALQLVGRSVKVYQPSSKETIIYDAAKVKERFGVEPERMVDLMALMGDATDNIPGVEGVGEKTAVELLKRYGSLDGVLAHAEEVEAEFGRVHLRQQEKIARLSQELALADTAVPIDVELEEMKQQPPDAPRLMELFKDLEFRSLLKELAPEAKLTGAYETITAMAGLKELCQTLKQAGSFAMVAQARPVAIGASDPRPMRAMLLGLAFAWAPGKAVYLPVAAADGRRTTALGPVVCDDDHTLLTGPAVLSLDEVRAQVKPLLEDATVGKIGHDLKTLQCLLADVGMTLRGVVFDTQIASYLINPAISSHDLADLALAHLNARLPAEKDIPMDQRWRLACQAADLALRVKDRLHGELEEKGLTKLFVEVELPLLDVLASMELAGVAIDQVYLAELSTEMGRRLERLTTQIYEMAGGPFNINSPKQLAEVLFGRLKLPVTKRGKTGPSTDMEVLERLVEVSPLPKALLAYRELAKLTSTYIDALPALVHPKTNRIHASFNQTVTATGRLSSSNPNLQNIPIRTEEGRKIRKAFIAGRTDALLLSVDYSQIELRVLAHLSEDPQLIEAFQSGADVHRYTACLIYGVKEQDVQPAMRASAKTVNFGVIYGMSPFGLSKALGISVEAARHFIDAYFERYPRVKSFLNELIEEARQHGYVSTIFHRRRYIPEIHSQNISVRQFAERTAINAPIQGSAADIIKLAMVQIWRELNRQQLKTQMIIQVHDELVFEVPKDELDGVQQMVKRQMESVVKLNIPIEVTMKTGNNWAERQVVE